MKIKATFRNETGARNRLKAPGSRPNMLGRAGQARLNILTSILVFLVGYVKGAHSEGRPHSVAALKAEAAPGK